MIKKKIKTILISGASEGIGKAIALKFLKKGFLVLGIGRNKKKLDAIKHDSFIGIVADLSKKETFADLKNVLDSYHFDILVNNAGVFIPGKLSDEKEGIYEQTMQTNIDSAYYLTRLVIPKINVGGYIFNMCSTASQMGYPNGGSYCISKFALLGFTKALREEFKGKIAVSAIMPGATYTNSWADSTEPKERFIKPNDIAEIIYTAYKIRKHTVVEEIVLRPHLGDF